MKELKKPFNSRTEFQCVASGHTLGNLCILVNDVPEYSEYLGTKTLNNL